MVDPQSSGYQTSFPFGAWAPLPHVARGRGREAGMSPKPHPLSLALSEAKQLEPLSLHKATVGRRLGGVAGRGEEEV